MGVEDSAKRDILYATYREPTRRAQNAKTTIMTKEL